MRVDSGVVVLMIGFLALAGFILHEVASYPRFITGGLSRAPGPDLFPRVLAFFIMALSALGITQEFYRSLRKQGESAEDGSQDAEVSSERETTRASGLLELLKSRSFRNLLLFLALATTYIWYLETLGFVVATVPFLLTTTALLGVKPLRGFIFSLVITLVIFLFFTKILKVVLPLGLLKWVPFLW